MNGELEILIMDIAQELNEDEEIELSSELTADTPLFGENGILDSMGLVSLVIAAEQAIEEKYSTPISLADEKALSQKNSPYRTIASLAAYAAAQLP